jgi:hypothetical protein
LSEVPISSWNEIDVCRRSWKRMFGRPAFLSMRFNSFDYFDLSKKVLIQVVIISLSCHLPLAASFTSSCSLLCASSSTMVPYPGLICR